MILSALDQFPLWQIYLFILVILFLSAEMGFYIGKFRKARSKDAGGEDKQTGSIMGASLGLLAFLLAFAFNIATNIHSERKGLVLEESNALGTLYLRSQMFEVEEADKLRQIIKDYVSLRLDIVQTLSNEEFAQGVAASEKQLNEIWYLVRKILQQSDSPIGTAPLINAANEVIDLHAKRINAGFKRLPHVNSFLLIFIAILTLTLMGYQSGLNGIRVLVPRTALILSLATVMIVIADLDRPGGSLIEVSQKAMMDLEKQLVTEAGKE